MSIIPEHTSKVLGETQLVLRHLLVHSLFYVDFVQVLSSLVLRENTGQLLRSQMVRVEAHGVILTTI